MKSLSAIRLAGVVAVLSTNAFAWGGRVHMDINRAAAMNVPDDMAAWRDYANLLSRSSIFPDLWKGADEAEGAKHYLDAERYGRITITNLPEDHARLFQVTGRDTAEDGLIPWVIVDLENKLTQAMAGNDWNAAAQVAAALGHYVADAHQPLHTTEHYDGNPGPDGKGIHMRWEERMPFFFWKAAMISPTPAHFIKDPWSEVLQELDQAHARYRELYTADHEATEAAGKDVSSPDYYQALWTRTQGLFTKQVNAAITDLSSLWYTAWIKAGRPPIPRPPKIIPEQSIWMAEPAAAKSHAIPFFMALGGVAGALIVILFLIRKRV